MNSMASKVMSSLVMLWMLSATCIFDTSAFSVNVSPSPIVTVVSGETLTVTCQWSKNHTDSESVVWFTKNRNQQERIGVFYSDVPCSQTSPFITVCNKTNGVLEVNVQEPNYNHGDVWTCEGLSSFFGPMDSAFTTVHVNTQLEPPEIIGISRVTPTSLTLVWKLNLNDVHITNVTIEYNYKDCPKSTLAVSDLSNIDQPVYTTINNLKADTEYTIRITAFGDVLSSRPTEINAATSEESKPSGIKLVATGGILISVSVVTFTISIILYRKSRNNFSYRTVGEQSGLRNTGLGSESTKERNNYLSFEQQDATIPLAQDYATGSYSDDDDESRTYYENVDREGARSEHSESGYIELI